MAHIASPPGMPRSAGFAAHVRALIVLAAPLAATQLAQIAITTTDVIMLGWYGTPELAASVLGGQSNFFFYVFGTGFAHAIVPLAAQAEGRGDRTDVRRSVRMGLWTVIVFAFLSLPVLTFIGPILKVLGQEPELSLMAQGYVRIIMWGLFPALAAMALRSFFAARASAQVVLWSTLAGTVANVLLNWIFIFGNLGAPEMGLNGAAIASVLSSFIMLAVIGGWAAFARGHRDYDLFTRFWRPDWQALRDVVRLGLPISLTIIAEVGLFMASSIMMGWQGVTALAAHGIALQLASISFMIPLGISNAATVFVGQAYGRGDKTGIARSAGAALLVAAVIAAFAALLFYTVPHTLVGLFLDPDVEGAPAILEMAVILLAVAAIFQIADSMQAVGAGLLRGIKDTRIPMMIAVFSYWGIGLPAAALYSTSLDLGAPGIWAGLATGLTVAAILLNWRFARRGKFLAA